MFATPRPGCASSALCKGHSPSGLLAMRRPAEEVPDTIRVKTAARRDHSQRDHRTTGQRSHWAEGANPQEAHPFASPGKRIRPVVKTGLIAEEGFEDPARSAFIPCGVCAESEGCSPQTAAAAARRRSLSWVPGRQQPGQRRARQSSARRFGFADDGAHGLSRHSVRRRK